MGKNGLTRVNKWIYFVLGVFGILTVMVTIVGAYVWQKQQIDDNTIMIEKQNGINEQMREDIIRIKVSVSVLIRENGLEEQVERELKISRGN